MAFGPESNNPRELRAYAHEMLAQFEQQEVPYDDVAALVERASATTKGQSSGLSERLAHLVTAQEMESQAAFSIEARYPQIMLPSNPMWPLRLHNPVLKAEVSQLLPELVQTLSKPIKPFTREDLYDLFDTNPHDRQRPWTSRVSDEGLTFSTEPYLGPKNEKGGQRIFYGINYTFDDNGRMVKLEYINDDGSYDRGRPRYQEFLTYDEDGYLTERMTWDSLRPTQVERFDYVTDSEGRKQPVQMITTVKVRTSDYRMEDSKPLVVDLANYEDWIATNPNGINMLTREQLNSKELELTEFEVTEHRSGIRFANPDELEQALVMYGDGSYPVTGEETPLEHNERAMSTSMGGLGGALFSMVMRSGDMHTFVQSEITGEVAAKWQQVQKSRKKGAHDQVRFSFDYDGAGHFHKTSGEIAITKSGLELTMHAAYVGSAVEERMADALHAPRALRWSSLTVPINQSGKEGYFLVDVKAACEKLGIPVLDHAIAEYLADYIPKSDESLHEAHARQYGKRRALWEDAENGIAVDLVTEQHDYEADVDLDKFFGQDGTALWGPLPREIRHASEADKNTPRLRVTVTPTGDLYAPETTAKTDEILRKVSSRIKR